MAVLNPPATWRSSPLVMVEPIHDPVTAAHTINMSITKRIENAWTESGRTSDAVRAPHHG